MKPTPDFARVEEHQLGIHEQALNWARWVRPQNSGYINPMWRWAKSNAWQWHQKEIRTTCDIIAAMKFEKMLRNMPRTHRDVLIWAYVYQGSPNAACKRYGLSMDGLMRHLRDARQMAMNLVD